MFRGVIDAEKTNKKENLKMGRRKRHERAKPYHAGAFAKGFTRGKRRHDLGAWGEPMPSQRAKMDGDILRRDDVMNLDKTRWERISKFSLKRILGPEGDQL